MSIRYPSLFLRLLANSVENEDEIHFGSCCWDWTGLIDRKGYGRFSKRVPGRASPVPFKAHRAMAELAVRRALHPKHETIDHGCVRRCCINPYHFRLASLGQNSLDRWARARGEPVPEIPMLIDRNVWIEPAFIRALPMLRSEMDEECPF